MRLDRRRLAGAALALCLVAGVRTPAQSPDAAQRDRIARLPVTQRDALYRRDAALRAMTPAQRDAFRQRLAQWRALPESERRQRRDRWQAWQALPAAERAQLRAAAVAFAALPVQEQLALRARYASLDESERRGWLLGAQIGADWPRLQPLLMQVPVGQRAPLLDALRALSPQQRVDLGVLAQRTPPQDRDQLRRELLAQSPGTRGAWLVRQLDK